MRKVRLLLLFHAFSHFLSDPSSFEFPNALETIVLFNKLDHFSAIQNINFMCLL